MTSVTMVGGFTRILRPNKLDRGGRLDFWVACTTEMAAPTTNQRLDAAHAAITRIQQVLDRINTCKGKLHELDNKRSEAIAQKERHVHTLFADASASPTDRAFATIMIVNYDQLLIAIDRQKEDLGTLLTLLEERLRLGA